MKPWVGVDLDGTLAEYTGEHNELVIGPPIQPMLSKIHQLLDDGLEVKIFTARIACEEPYRTTVYYRIKKWLKEIGLEHLEITNIKDGYMVELYDDRAVQVEWNSGKVVGYSTLQHRRLYKNLKQLEEPNEE